jgi:hypothetical protein
MAGLRGGSSAENTPGSVTGGLPTIRSGLRRRSHAEVPSLDDSSDMWPASLRPGYFRNDIEEDLTNGQDLQPCPGTATAADT